MGFCLVNNAVVAARHAQRAGRERVLIVDWDVHHGNAPRRWWRPTPRSAMSRFTSTLVLGTGMADERGVGNVFNVPRGRVPGHAVCG